MCLGVASGSRSLQITGPMASEWKKLRDDLAYYEELVRKQKLKVSEFYQKHEDYEAASRWADSAFGLTGDPELNARQLYVKGELKLKQEDYEQAAIYFGRALLIEPLNEEIWYGIHERLALCLARVGDFLGAESYARAAIRLNARRHRAYTCLGLSLEGQKKDHAAVKAYLKATELYPRDEEAVGRLRTLVRRDRMLLVLYRKRLEALERALRRSSGE